MASSSISCCSYRTFHSYRKSQVLRIRELFRFVCGQLFLRCQVALVLHEKLVDSVGKMLVDLTHLFLHVVERFLVRDIVDSGDVLCSPVSVERVPRDLELSQSR